jgi:hypothetical protein
VITYAFDLYPRDNPVAGARVLRFSKLQEAEYRGEANGTGSGRIVLRGTSTDAASIDPAGMQYIRVVRINDAVVDGATLSGFSEKVVGGFFLENGEYEALTERSTKTLTFGGAGALSYLGRAVAAEETYIAGAEGPFDGIWHWYFSPAGAILHRMVTEALDPDRPQSPITGVTLTFTEDLDSDGNAWPGYGVTWLFTAQVGENLLAIMRRLMEAGVYVFMDPDTFALSAYMESTHGRDRTGVAWGTNVVRFQAPTDGTIATGNIKSDAKRGLGALIKRSDLLVGSAEGYEWVNDPAADLVWEGSYPVDDPDGTSLSQIGAAQLQARSDAGDTVRLRMIPGTTPASGTYLPFESAGILLDDTVTLHNGTGQWDWDETAQKVAAIALKLRSAGDWDAWVDLGSQYSSIEQRAFANTPVGAHTHPPNPRLCDRHEIYTVTKIYRYAENAHEFGVAVPTPEVLHTHIFDTPASEETTNSLLGTVGPFAIGSVGWYFTDTTAGLTWYATGDTNVLREDGPLAAGPESWKPALPAGAYRLYWFDQTDNRGLPDTGAFESNLVIQIEPALAHLSGSSSEAARCDHLHAIEELLTPEVDTTLRLAPDGEGGVAWTTGGASLPWFIVTDYGAVGDGTTDDTSAINDAIAALNAAGGGVLYFPVGTYLCSSALTTISVPALIRGDGSAAYDGTSPISLITCSSGTADLFTITAKHAKFEDIALANTAGTPSAGSGISTQGAYLGQRVDYEGVVIRGFYINWDIQVGAQWTMHNCEGSDPVLYAVKIQNTVNADAGDWTISDSEFLTDTHAATAAIRIQSSGGGKIVNSKVNQGGAQKFTHGVDLALSGATATGVLLISNSSIENVTGDGIHGTQVGTSTYTQIIIHGNQIGLASNNSGKAISLVAEDAGALSVILIGLNTFRTNGTARSAVQITNCDYVTFVGNLLSLNFTSLYTNTTSTNVTEITAGVTDHGALTGLADDDHPQYLTDAEHDAVDHTGLPGVGGAGLLTVDAGSPTYDDSGADVVISLSSKWGHDADGPYFNSVGVTSGEEAILAVDTLTGEFAVVPYNP